MARIVKPLTVFEIDESKPKDQEYALFDGDGLMLIIKPNQERVLPDGTKFVKEGSKTWVYRFKSPEDGKDKKITIGQYLPKNKGVSLKQAREERDRLKMQLKEGIVPVGKKKAKTIEQKQIEVENDKLIANVVADFLEHQTTVLNRNQVHLEKQKRRMEMYVLPFVSPCIDDITKKEIADCIKKIDPKHNETAHRVLTLCGQIWSWACDNGRVEHNVIADINKKSLLPPQKRDNHYPTITDPQRIAALLQAIDEYPGDPSTRYALRLAPYMGLRPGTLRLAEWDEFDWTNKLWTIPARKMKGKKRDHLMPLTDTMIDIIMQAAPYSRHRSSYLFPSPADPTKPLSDNTLNVGLKRLGFGEEIVTHGFRGMFSTIANEHRNIENGHKIDRDIIEFHLAHTVQSKVAEAYNHADYIEQRRELAQWWSDYLDRLKQENA